MEDSLPPSQTARSIPSPLAGSWTPPSTRRCQQTTTGGLLTPPLTSRARAGPLTPTWGTFPFPMPPPVPRPFYTSSPVGSRERFCDPVVLCMFVCIVVLESWSSVPARSALATGVEVTASCLQLLKGSRKSLESFCMSTLQDYALVDAKILVKRPCVVPDSACRSSSSTCIICAAHCV